MISLFIVINHEFFFFKITPKTNNMIIQKLTFEFSINKFQELVDS